MLNTCFSERPIMLKQGREEGGIVRICRDHLLIISLILKYEILDKLLIEDSINHICQPLLISYLIRREDHIVKCDYLGAKCFVKQI